MIAPQRSAANSGELARAAAAIVVSDRYVRDLSFSSADSADNSHEWDLVRSVNIRDECFEHAILGSMGSADIFDGPDVRLAIAIERTRLPRS